MRISTLSIWGGVHRWERNFGVGGCFGNVRVSAATGKAHFIKGLRTFDSDMQWEFFISLLSFHLYNRFEDPAFPLRLLQFPCTHALLL